MSEPKLGRIEFSDPNFKANVEEREELAHKMINDLCRRKNDPQSRDWIMSIPAREDYDPDLIIGASLRDIPALLTKLATVEADNVRLKNAFEGFVAGLECNEPEALIKLEPDKTRQLGEMMAAIGKRYRASLEAIRDMPNYDQDNEHRMRHIAKQALEAK